MRFCAEHPEEKKSCISLGNFAKKLVLNLKNHVSVSMLIVSGKYQRHPPLSVAVWILNLVDFG